MNIFSRAPRKFVASVMLVLLGLGAAGCSTLFGGDGDKPEIRRVAILPFAYRDAAHTVPCTLCPDELVLAKTSHEDAMLVTAFFHEALTSYPGLTVLSSDSVDRFSTEDMSESLDRLFAVEAVDAVLVGALMELRPREGDPREPTSSAGAAVYAALVEPLTRRVLWSGLRDADQESPPVTLQRASEIISGQPVRWRSALGQAQQYAQQLTKEMVKRIH